MTSLIVGMLAAIITTGSFIPQAVKAFKTKDTKSLSLVTFSLFALGVFLWLIYGVLIKEWPIIIANGAAFILAVCILMMKIRYK